MYIQKQKVVEKFDVRNEWRGNQQSLQKGFVAFIAICWPMFITRHRTDTILLLVLFFLFCFLPPSLLYHSDHPVSPASLYHFFYLVILPLVPIHQPRTLGSHKMAIPRLQTLQYSNACSPQFSLPVNNILTPMTQWMTVADAWWKHPIHPRIVRSCGLRYMQIDFGVHLLKTNVSSLRISLDADILLHKIIHRITNKSLQIIDLKNTYTPVGQSDT